MSAVTANLVRDLREKTNAGMLDCKKALEESKGDFEAAIEWLRKKGLASAGKKADRVAAEGSVFASVTSGTLGVVVEVNSETDFVARNDGFKDLVKEVANHLSQSKKWPADAAELLGQHLATRDDGKTVDLLLKEAIAKIGENLVIRRFAKFDSPNGYVHSYIHGEGKIGVLVELRGSVQSGEVKTLAADLCLHVAAMNPMGLSQADIPAAVVEKEKEILKARNLEQGKKPEMLDKIVEGQIKKFLSESCMLEQPFVKNPDIKVKEYIAEVAKKSGGAIEFARFVRFELGEGIQKKVSNFAEEVAAQAKVN